MKKGVGIGGLFLIMLLSMLFGKSVSCEFNKEKVTKEYKVK